MNQARSAINARRLLLGLVAIAVVLSSREVVMSQARTGEGVKNVVLVHGGFVDGSGWQGVYDLLKNDGFNVTVVQNPTTSLADDVAVTKRALAVPNTKPQNITFVFNDLQRQVISVSNLIGRF